MRLIAAWLLCLLFIGGSAAVAQTQIPVDEPTQKFRRYVGAGISAPTGRLDDGGRRGFHFWGRLGYVLSRKLELAIGPEYHTFDRDNQGQFGTHGGRFYTLMLAADIRLNLGRDQEFRNSYFLAGAGVAFLEALPLTTIARGTERFESTYSAFMEGGFGVELGWTFLQVKVVWVPREYIGDRLVFIPFSVGLRL